MTKKLRAPEGTDEANFGDERYPVRDDGTIEVPDDVAASLEGVGGFTEVVDAPPVEAEAPSEFAKIRHPEGVGCSFGGVSYEPDADGLVHVPHAAVQILAAHGFEAVE